MRTGGTPPAKVDSGRGGWFGVLTEGDSAGQTYVRIGV